MAFESLTDTPRGELVQITAKLKASKAPTKKQLERGCDHCPRNGAKGINKVKGKVRGKQLFIIGMAPGKDENTEKKEFVGKSGKFLWQELAQHGIKRKDVDVQNVVRCYPADRKDGTFYMRDPTKEELHACSLYTDRAVAKSKAKVYIVLGGLAQKQFLGKEYKKTRKIFWSERLQAKVYCLYHPSYFVRGQYPQSAIDGFRKGLEAAASDLNGKETQSRLSYLEKQDYEAIVTVKQALHAERIIRAAAEKKIRIALDVEDDTIKDKRTDLVVGFSYKPGQAFVFVTNHPLARKVGNKWRPLKKVVRNKIRRIAKSIIEDKSIKKILHHGDSDTRSLKKTSNIALRGYDYDTEYAEYLADPDGRAYGLGRISERRFPAFGEYKTIVYPYILPKDIDLAERKIEPTDYAAMYQLAKKAGMRFSQLPLKLIVLYNGADCDLTKRIELTTKKRINMPLLRIYRDAAFVLSRMEGNGPAFDYIHWEKLKRLYPPRLERVYDKLKQIAGKTYTCTMAKKNKDTNKIEYVEKVMWDNSSEKTEFNPASHLQVKALLFRKLKIEVPIRAFKGASGFPKRLREVDRKKDGRFFATDSKGEYREIQPSTGKGVLELLVKIHEAPQLLTEYRRLDKIESTYLDSYEKCARAHQDLLRTTWWLTGTRTGRLSSGGTKEDEDGDVKTVNLQNIHGDPNLKNQVVADPRWRVLYKAIHKAIKQSIGSKYVDAISEIQGRLSQIPQYHPRAKDKRKAIEAELYDKDKGVVPKFHKALSKSLRFKKLCKRIVRRLGDIQVLLGFDQGQVEVRVMAQASGDKNLIRDCKAGDIHSQVGHAMTGWKIEDIKKDKKTRTLTKNIHFGILFGLGENGLFDFIKAKDPDTDITEERAKELLANYFKAYPKVAQFIEDCREFVEKHGYIVNMFGFRRPLGNARSEDGFDADDSDFGAGDSSGPFWGNQAVNTPVQGAAHCLMLMAMAVMKRNRKKYRKMLPTLEIHDYMGFRIALRDIFETFKLGKELLEQEPLKIIKKEYPEIKWKIPLVVEGQVGLRLGDSIEAEEDGKMMSMPKILSSMFLESYMKEVRLDADLALAA